MRFNPRGIQHELPGLDPPVPIVERIEHDQRSAASTRRAVIPDVAIDGIGQVGGVIASIPDFLQFVLERERQAIQLIQRGEREFQVGQFLGIELIVRQDLGQESIETRQLVRSKFIRCQSLASSTFFE